MITLIRAEPLTPNGKSSCIIKQNINQSKLILVIARECKTKQKYIFLLLFAGTDTTPLCILHINEPFYHTKTDYCGSAFITNTSVKEA